jgi:hypothetical protein
MLKIEYEIKLNEHGRPYIDLPLDYDNKAEDKFFVLELTRYVLQEVFKRRSAEFDPFTADKLNDCIGILEQVSDEVAMILYNQMEIMGDVALTIHNDYHIQVENIEERNNLPRKGIIYNGKIFRRQEGLKVLTYNDMIIYELREGIENENWFEIMEK